MVQPYFKRRAGVSAGVRQVGKPGGNGCGRKGARDRRRGFRPSAAGRNPMPRGHWAFLRRTKSMTSAGSGAAPRATATAGGGAGFGGRWAGRRLRLGPGWPRLARSLSLPRGTARLSARASTGPQLERLLTARSLALAPQSCALRAISWLAADSNLWRSSAEQLLSGDLGSSRPFPSFRGQRRFQLLQLAVEGRHVLGARGHAGFELGDARTRDGRLLLIRVLSFSSYPFTRSSASAFCRVRSVSWPCIRCTSASATPAGAGTEGAGSRRAPPVYQ